MVKAGLDYVDQTPELGSLSRGRRRRLGRGVWEHIDLAADDGCRDYDELVARTANGIRQDQKYGTLLGLILIAVLLEVIKFLVRLWLENRTED